MLPGVKRPRKTSQAILAEITGKDAILTLYNRKTYYKDQAKLAAKNIQHIQQLLQEETKMKRMWQTASLMLAVVVVTTFTCLITLKLSSSNQPVKMIPVSGHITTKTRPQVLSSVFVENGGVVGGGSVISRGPKYAAILSCAHIFNGVIGGPFKVYFADSSSATATLLAIDKDLDLSLARVPVDAILGNTYITRFLPSEKLTAIGFPGGRGPMFEDVSYVGTDGNGKWVFNFPTVLSGAGMSGNGVYQGDVLCGVSVEQAQSYCGNNITTNVVHALNIIDFLNRNQQSLAGCGDWGKPPSYATAYDGGWYASSNVILPPDHSIVELRKKVNTVMGHFNTVMQQQASDHMLLTKLRIVEKQPEQVRQPIKQPEKEKQPINQPEKPNRKPINTGTPVVPTYVLPTMVSPRPSHAGPRKPINADQERD